MTHHHPRRQSAAWPPIQMLAQQVNQQVNRGNLRVGDAERDEAARALGDHFATGRLDREEYDERLEAVFAARTGADLSAVFRDLPQPRLGQQRRPAPSYSRPRRSGFRLPFLPVLLVLIGLAIAFNAGWIVLVGLGVLLVTGRLGCFGHSHRSRTA